MTGRGSFNALRLSSGLASIAIIFQILLGALVRLTDSGLACPDWPLCYGLWFPTETALAGIPAVNYSFGQVMLEWGHRLNAAVVVSPLIVAVFLFAWRERDVSPMTGKLGIAALVILVLQGAAGGLTVFDRNSPWSVAIHLGLALVLLSLIISIARMNAVSNFNWKTHSRRNRCRVISMLAGLVLATMLSGAIVAKVGATASCAGWPLCNGQLVPNLSDSLVLLHFMHRVLALTTLIGIVSYACWMQSLRHLAALVILQVVVGAGVTTIYAGNSFTLQIAIGVFHQFFAVIVFATLVWLIWTPAPASADRCSPK